MKILVAVDQHPYSTHAVNEMARVAANTLANVTLLGIIPRNAAGAGEPSSLWTKNHPLVETLRRHREHFLDQMGKDENPYLNLDLGYELVEMKKGVWEEVCRGTRKALKARIRRGNPAKEILAQAREDDSDLIVVGSSKAEMGDWEDGSKVPQTVANEASCSVLVAKQGEKVNKIVCCLDHNQTSQSSLEMINQMVTLHQTDLEIVGITEGEELKADVERKMSRIFKYYTDRKITPYIKLVPLPSLESFIATEAGHSLCAIWMGKKSMLERVFPRSKVNRLIKASRSSVLILR